MTESNEIEKLLDTVFWDLADAKRALREGKRESVKTWLQAAQTQLSIVLGAVDDK